MNTMKARNCENFLGNEGKDMKQQNFFTVNNRQHMVAITICIISHPVHMHMVTLPTHLDIPLRKSSRPSQQPAIADSSYKKLLAQSMYIS